MLADLKVGQTVRVWPTPGLHVLVDPRIPGRFLRNDGAEVAWSPWWHRRVLDGSVLLTNPSPTPNRQPAPTPAATPNSEAKVTRDDAGRASE